METLTSLDSRVQINNDVLFQELQGESVLLNLNTGVYLGLDPVGTRIWRLLEKNASLRNVVIALLDEYEVAEDRCTLDLLNLIEQMRSNGLVQLNAK